MCPSGKCGANQHFLFCRTILANYLARQLDLKQDAAGPRHRGLPFSVLRRGAPSIPPALGKGREVTRVQLFIPIHSNPVAMKMLTPGYGFQTLYLQVHWACTSGETAHIAHCPHLLHPCPSCSSRTWSLNTLWTAWPVSNGPGHALCQQAPA